MSYILDALRKSDQQRQRGTAPTLRAVQIEAALPRRRVSTSNVLLAGGLVGAGVAIGVLGPWLSAPPTPVTGSTATAPLDSHPPRSSAAAPTQPSVKAEREAPAQKSAVAERPVPARAADAPKRRESTTRKTEQKAEAREASRAAVTAAPKKMARASSEEKRAAAVSGDAAQEQNVLTIAELPESVRQEIPKMSFSVHAYSATPKDRLVGINDRVLREGEQVQPGLKLESITLDGVIMSYKGYRFRRGVR